MTIEAIPIDVVDLLPTLHKKLIDLLKSLSHEDWQRKTVAKLWTVKLTITTGIGGSWFLTRLNEEWKLSKEELKKPDSEIQIHPDIAWRLFSKSIRPDEVKSDVKIIGDEKLGVTALSMVSVMA